MKYYIPLFVPLFLAAASCDSGEPDGPDSDNKPAASPGYVPVTVIEYCPAPGQFVNEMPEYREGMTASDMTAAANSAVAAGDLVSLGGWGGYIVYRLDKYIANTPGADFRVVGNAYYSFVKDGVQYGNCEPGIVYVMADTNGNGLPDDTWYELCGSHTSAGEIVDVEYTQREIGESVFEINAVCSTGENQTWTSDPEFHPHSYAPLWCGESVMRFSGRLLPANGEKLANGQYSQICYTGYADARPNNDDTSALDISSAIDKDGNPVALERIDFIKVQTGVLQFNGPIGECSTETGRIQAL